MGIGGLTIVRQPFQVLGIIGTLGDHVEHHRHSICGINGLGSDRWELINELLETIHRKETRSWSGLRRDSLG